MTSIMVACAPFRSRIWTCDAIYVRSGWAPHPACGGGKGLAQPHRDQSVTAALRIQRPGSHRRQITRERRREHKGDRMTQPAAANMPGSGPPRRAWPDGVHVTALAVSVASFMLNATQVSPAIRYIHHLG